MGAMSLDEVAQPAMTSDREAKAHVVFFILNDSMEVTARSKDWVNHDRQQNPPLGVTRTAAQKPVTAGSIRTITDGQARTNDGHQHIDGQPRCAVGQEVLRLAGSENGPVDGARDAADRRRGDPGRKGVAECRRIQ
jgi:hypothetical protein